MSLSRCSPIFISLVVFWSFAWAGGEVPPNAHNCKVALGGESEISGDAIRNLFSAFLDEPKTEDLAPPLYKEHIKDAEPPYTLKDEMFVWARADEELAPVPFQGWKLHVTCDETNMSQVLSLLPELRKKQVSHKVISDDDYYLNDLNERKEGNIGKFLTIYPRSEKEAEEIAIFLDQRLKVMGAKKTARHESRLKNSNLQLGDIQLGQSGLLYTRYGGMGGILVERNGVEGVESEVNGRTFFVPYQPDIKKFLINPEGKLVPDTRDAIPDWLQIPQGIQTLRVR